MTINKTSNQIAPPQSPETADVSLLDINVDSNKRLIKIDEANVAELARSMQDQGLLHPIVLWFGDAGMQLLSGWHRLEAAKKLGWTHIRATIIENDMDADQRML